MIDLFESKNRLATSLPLLDLQLVWEGGELTIDPNGLAMHAAYGTYPVGLPLSKQASILSGKPAYFFRSDDIEVPLTLEELDRFCRYALKPKEFKKLLGHYGMFYHIHDDFYDPASGQSMQPKRMGTGFSDTQARVQSLQEKKALEVSTSSSLITRKPKPSI